MAVGVIEQFKGPFNSNSTLSSDGNCKIGISIGQDDFYLLGSTSGDKGLRFLINGKQIWMGRTYMYETGEQIDNTVISFPDGAPPSTTVNMMYCSKYTNQYNQE